MKRIIKTIILMYCSSLLFAQSGTDTVDSAEGETPLTVIVSIPPLGYLVKNIGGAYVAVDSFLVPGQAPETFDVTPEGINAVLSSDLYITAGFLYEEKIEKLGTVRVFHTLDALGLSDEHADEEQADEYKHVEDNHIWLSPRLMQELVPAIQEELTHLLPEKEQYFAEQAKQTTEKLSDVETQIRTLLAPLQNRSFLSYHDAFSYFADEFNLNDYAIELEGKEPSMKWIVELQGLIKEENIQIILAQPQFSTKSVELLAVWGNIRYILIDILVSDWEKMMLSIAQALVDNG